MERWRGGGEWRTIDRWREGERQIEVGENPVGREGNGEREVERKREVGGER